MAFGRRRSMLGWSLLTIAAAGVGLAVLSAWRRVTLRQDTWFVSVGGGVLTAGWRIISIAFPEPAVEVGPIHPQERFAWVVLPEVGSIARDWRVASYARAEGFGLYGRWVAVVWWAPVLGNGMVGGACVLSGSRARRRRGPCCPCGYDLAGLGESAACPECGLKPIRS